MTLKEYLERQLRVNEALIKTVQGEVIKDYFHSILVNERDLIKEYLQDVEFFEPLKETKWAPVVGEYCWFIEGTMEMEGDTLHLCKVIDIVTSGGYAEWVRNKLENTYRIVTSTEEVHEVPLSSLEKFEGTLPSVIRERGI